MDMDPGIDIEALVFALLQKRERDYLTVKQIVAGLPASARRRLALTSRQTTAALLGQLMPWLGQSLQVYKVARSSYIGRKLPPEDLILRCIGRKPGISSKQLGTQLPMAKKTYIASLNALLQSGAMVCTLRENHTLCLMLADPQVPLPTLPSVVPEAIKPEEARSAFKTVYERVGQGGDFVRIHRLRDGLGWPRERFEQVLLALMADYTVELHGGDPSLLTAAELHDSYTDPQGTLYITMSWRGQP